MEIFSKETCRTCLSAGGILFPFFDSVLLAQNTQTTSVTDFLKLFTRISISSRSFPAKICSTCLDEIKRAYAFKIKCEKSEDTLKKLINNRQLSNNASKPMIIIDDDSNLVDTHFISKKTTNPQQLDSICVKEEIIDVPQLDPISFKEAPSPPPMVLLPSYSIPTQEDDRMEMISSARILGERVNTLSTKSFFNTDFIDKLENDAHAKQNDYLVLLQIDVKYPPESNARSYDPTIQNNAAQIDDIMEQKPIIKQEPMNSNCVNEISENKPIKDKFILRREMRKKGSPFQCRICMKSFKSSHTFMSHQQFGHITYSCKYCSMKLKDKNKYRKHVLQHEVLSCVFGN